MTRLPILMYHNVCINEKESNDLTIFNQRLENQLRYLKKNGYTSLHFSDLENAKDLPEKSVVITFDDVTQNQLFYAVPLLKKYNLKATFFIPFGYIGLTDVWNEGKEKIMSIAQLKDLDKSIELGFHSFAHKKYSTLSQDEINHDFEKCFEIMAKNHLNVYNALAYPYGKYPKKEPNKSIFHIVLQQNNIKFGLKIGNKINKFPFKNPYEITRIDVKGNDSLWRFKLKLRFGKLKLF